MSLKLTILISLILLVEISSAKSNHKSDLNWRNHAKKHNLAFKSDDRESKAYDNYLTTDELINKHNKDGSHRFKLAHNHLSHLNKTERQKITGHVPLTLMTSKQFRNKRGISSGFTVKAGYIWTPMQNTAIFGGINGYYYTPTPGYVPPASVNWIQRGFNKPVLNQGYCGNCYAFAVAASIEGSLFALNKTNVTLSPQQITDCSGGSLYANYLCNGGNAGNSYFYASKNGVCSASLYPFTSGSSGIAGTCSIGKCSGGTLYKVKTFYRSQAGSDAAVMEMLDKLGPLYVSINANDPFGYYASGVYASTSGCSNSTNHAVLLVGYGTDTKTKLPIWTIKNQWSSYWGAAGYMNISRAITNNCGISMGASFPLL